MRKMTLRNSTHRWVVLGLTLIGLIVAATERPVAALSENYSLFFELCATGSPEIVRRAIRNGADVNERDADGWSPLIVAAQSNPDSDVIRILLEHGADVNAADKLGWTPLLFAAQTNANPKTHTVLLEHGANLKTQSTEGGRSWTPLSIAAAYSSNREVVRILVYAGASVNTVDSFGETALITAARYSEYPEVIEELIHLGADVNARDADGKCALDYAKENGSLNSPALLKILQPNDPLFDSPDQAPSQKTQKIE